MKINATSDSFAFICICAIRYCMGRMTYAPGIVIPVVLGNLDKFSDKNLGVLIRDAEEQKQRGNYGDPKVDKPLWEDYAAKLFAERVRRKSNAGQ